MLSASANAEPASGRIEIKIDRFFYGRMVAVQDVHFDIPKNRVTAFIGPSGCGKSTALRCLNRMHPSNRTRLEGKIRFDEQNLYAPRIDPRMVCIHVGRVFGFHLIAGRAWSGLSSPHE